MSIKYVPICRAKPGEIEALKRTKESHIRRILPLFEVPKLPKDPNDWPKWLVRSPTPVVAQFDRAVDLIASVFGDGSTVIADASQWQAAAVAEDGRQVSARFCAELRARGVRVVPVAGYDRWDSVEYRLAMKSVGGDGAGSYCLRLDADALEDAGDPEFFYDRISTMLDDLELGPAQCSILLDHGDVTPRSVATLIAEADAALEVLGPMGFQRYITAGCSLPSSIDQVVRKPNSSAVVLRKEMLLWEALRTSHPDLPWVFGDYGVRGPSSSDIKSTHTNGKIRHTIEKAYYILRGHSVRQGPKWGQMYDLASTLVSTPYFGGTNLSWGDGQIEAVSRAAVRPGNATKWIAFDTSHHLAHVVLEVLEFERQIAVRSLT